MSPADQPAISLVLGTTYGILSFAALRNSSASEIRTLGEIYDNLIVDEIQALSPAQRERLGELARVKKLPRAEPCQRKGTVLLSATITDWRFVVETLSGIPLPQTDLAHLQLAQLVRSSLVCRGSAAEEMGLPEFKRQEVRFKLAQPITFGDGEPAAFNRKRQETGLAKVGKVAEIVRKRTGKVVVLGVHKRFLEDLALNLRETGERPVFIGERVQGKQDIQDAIDGFRVNDFRDMLGTFGALGTGYNLQAADTLVVGELNWDIGVHIQGEGRIRRLGIYQNAKVSVLFM